MVFDCREPHPSEDPGAEAAVHDSPQRVIRVCDRRRPACSALRSRSTGVLGDSVAVLEGVLSKASGLGSAFRRTLAGSPERSACDARPVQVVARRRNRSTCLKGRRYPQLSPDGTRGADIRDQENDARVESARERSRGSLQARQWTASRCRMANSCSARGVAEQTSWWP